LISLGDFKVGTLEFVSTGKPKTPFCVGPYWTTHFQPKDFSYFRSSSTIRQVKY
jgi:hypothetical protein